MSDGQVQDAKARFSELLKITLKHGPQIVTLGRDSRGSIGSYQ